MNNVDCHIFPQTFLHKLVKAQLEKALRLPLISGFSQLFHGY